MMTWKLVPMLDRPAKGGIILAIAVGAFLLGTFAFGGILVGALGFCLVAGSCAEYWLGIKFEIDEAGARRKVGVSVTEMPWERVKRVVVKHDGVLISPLSGESTLSPFRGVFLQFSKNKDEVLSAVSQYGGDFVQGLE